MSSSRSAARRILGGALVSLLAVAGLAVAAPASAEMTQLTINGVASNPAGDLLVGESVTIFTNIDIYETQTDENGEFSITVDYDTTGWTIDYLVAGVYGMIDIASLGGATETYISVVTPVTATFTIQGFLTDAYGTAVSGVEVWAYATAGSTSSISDETGFYSVTVTQDVAGAAVICVMGAGEGGCLDVSGQEGDVITLDITVGTGNVSTVLLEGVVLDLEGAPVPNAFVTISTNVTYYGINADENGAFSQQIEYTEFGAVDIWAETSWIHIDAASLLGQEVYSVVVQQQPAVLVTFTGTVTDVEGNPVPNHVVVAYGQASAYTFTDAAGHYEVSVLADPFASVYVATDGNGEPYFYETPLTDSTIEVDLVTYFDGTENSRPIQQIMCDINGDGNEDSISNYRTIASGRNDWYLDLGSYDWASATFGQGDIAETYCADLNGDGASEIIARADTSKYHPRTDKTSINHTWWIYEYTTDTVTERTFGKGELSVYFENLDDVPGVELIATRTGDTNGKWWVLDDAASEVETFNLGFGLAGTISFEDVNGVPGVEIVTSKLKENGRTRVEYYTRATGEGSIVAYTVK